jgi:nucleoside 2-deoxyribosyltransferase
MADNWLKALGSKLVDAGAAYLQQARLVHELKSMPLDRAREKFNSYVQGLSESARAGFSLTLAALANGEQQAEAKRFIEMLRAALANPAAWNTGNGAAPASPQKLVSAPAAQAAPTQASFDTDVDRLEAWLLLDDSARSVEVERYVERLDDAQISAFKVNMEQALSNVSTRISDHRENEARIVAGRYFEDQQIYRLGRIGGAKPDAAWQATLNNYERVKTFIEQLLRFLAAVQDERAQPLAAPPPPKPRERQSLSPQILALRQMLEDELKAGRVQAERVPAYRRMLDKMESITEASGRGEIGPDVAEARMQELIADFMRYVADPGTASAKATPRGREVLGYAGALKSAVLREAKNNPPAATSDALGAILGDLIRVQTDVAAAKDDAMLHTIEAELMRPLARNWHDLALTRHALVACPLWESNEVTRSVNTVFHSGAADLIPMIEEVAAGKRLQVDTGRRLQNVGQLRWDALNACHVAVFDLRRAPEIAELAVRAPKRARELTGTAYELGLALALGKPMVVLTSPGEALPFDIDLSPMLIDGSDDDAPELARALDEAFYAAQRKSRGNAIPAGLAELDRLTREHPRRASIEGMGWLAPALKDDPMGFATAVRQVLREIGQPQWQLLRPAWPGVYPDDGPPRCFHVMPYAPAWADESAETARAACKRLGLNYRLGKEAEENRIVHAIWDDLCRANVVLVELAGGNLNVMIELGIAHALGRPVLAVQRNGGHDVRPPHIEKMRVHRYDNAQQLSTILLQRLKP